MPRVWRFLLLVVAIGAARGTVSAQLPGDAGQVWKTYDISPFVNRNGVGSQRHVVDWVLQETGYAGWHGDVVASLSADESRLRCYHTPAMQARVAEIAERFTADAAAPHRFSIRVFGVGSPAWRNDARALLQPIPAATPGVQAWIMAREEAAVLVAILRRRADCVELPTGPVLAANGLPAVVSGGRKRPYVQDVLPRADAWPGWQTLGGACDEGMTLDVQPLLSRDGTSVDAVFRCRIDQVERMAAVTVPVPAGDRRTVQVQVPQIAAVRVGERFRWPAGQVLVVGLGLVPWPVPGQNTAASATLLADAKRTDVVVVVEPRLGSAP
ncbi:MAG: hypothetical protein EBZ74_05420 [Planctomycetia bacterium]|nr:hypothetical protein [Planctomycetia bacterium]